LDFHLEEEFNAIKKKMVHDNKDKLGEYLFDSSVLFTSQTYHPDVSLLYLIFVCRFYCERKKSSAIWHPCQRIKHSGYVMYYDWDVGIKLKWYSLVSAYGNLFK
jgi:hypothetical protein